jgi:hypothetical protein
MFYLAWLILSVFESKSGQKYENKCNISNIRPYPICFHPGWWTACPRTGVRDRGDRSEDDGDAADSGANAITVKRHYWDWIDDDDNGDSERNEVAAAGERAH